MEGYTFYGWTENTGKFTGSGGYAAGKVDTTDYLGEDCVFPGTDDFYEEIINYYGIWRATGTGIYFMHKAVTLKSITNLHVYDGVVGVTQSELKTLLTDNGYTYSGYDIDDVTWWYMPADGNPYARDVFDGDAPASNQPWDYDNLKSGVRQYIPGVTTVADLLYGLNGAYSGSNGHSQVTTVYIFPAYKKTSSTSYTITFAPGTNGVLTQDAGNSFTASGNNFTIDVADGSAIGVVPGHADAGGYTFSGWHVGSDTSNLRDDAYVQALVPTAATTITGVWERASVSWTVTIDNGDTTKGTVGGTTSFTVADGNAMTAAQVAQITLTPTIVSGIAYRHAGWSTDAAGANTITPTSRLVTADVIYFAQWEVDTYTVTFVTGDSSKGAVGGTTSFQVAPSATLTATQVNSVTKTPVTSGDIQYKFSKYTSDAAGNTQVDPTSNAITGVTTYYVQWEVDKYKVSFTTSDANGNTCSGSGYVVAGATLGTTVAPTLGTQPGYELSYYYESAAPGTHLTSSQLPSQTIDGVKTYYAVFSVKTGYSITFDEYGVDATDLYSGTPATDLTGLAYTGSVTLPTLTWEGHTFKGWYLSTDTGHANKIEGGTFAAVDADAYPSSLDTHSTIALKAYWTNLEYTVKYDLNGASGSAPDASILYNGVILLPTSITRNGYTQVGWYSAEGSPIANGVEPTASGIAINGSTTKYSDIGSATAGSSITIHLIWTEDIATITYAVHADDLNSGDTGATFTRNGITTDTGAATITEYVGKATGYRYTDATGTALLTGSSTPSNVSSGVKATFQTASGNAVYEAATPMWTTTSDTSTSVGNSATAFAPGKNSSSNLYEDASYLFHVKPVSAYYVVYVYRQNLNDNNYTADATAYTSGTADIGDVIAAQGATTTYDALISPHSITGFTYDHGNYITMVYAATASAAKSAGNEIKLYYNRETYNVTSIAFDGNEPSSLTGQEPSVSVNGSAITTSTPVRYGATVDIAAISGTIPVGYTFNGWSSTQASVTNSSSDTSASFTMPASNVTLSGAWGKKSYTVTYTAGSYGSIGTPTSTTATIDEYIGQAPTPTPNSGYYFAYWSYTGASGTGQRSYQPRVQHGEFPHHRFVHRRYFHRHVPAHLRHQVHRRRRRAWRFLRQDALEHGPDLFQYRSEPGLLLREFGRHPRDRREQPAQLRLHLYLGMDCREHAQGRCRLCVQGLEHRFGWYGRVAAAERHHRNLHRHDHRQQLHLLRHLRGHDADAQLRQRRWRLGRLV